MPRHSADFEPNRLFATGAYTDCTIRCHNDIYRVHKALICTRSTFFAAAFNSSMKVCNPPLYRRLDSF